MVFQDTIENNIKFGKPHATNEEVLKAASWKLAYKKIKKQMRKKIPICFFKLSQ